MAGTTKTHFIVAPVRYVKVHEQDKDMGNGGKIDFSDENGRFSLTAVLTEDQKAELVSNGCPEKSMGWDMFKLDKDGNPTYNFKRPHTHKKMRDRKTNERVVFGAPDVFDMDKSMAAWKEAGTGELRDHLVMWDREEDGIIWNGSVCKIKYSVYKGDKDVTVVRLESVAVLELAAKPTQDAETTSPEDAYF